MMIFAILLCVSTMVKSKGKPVDTSIDAIVGKTACYAYTKRVMNHSIHTAGMLHQNSNFLIPDREEE